MKAIDHQLYIRGAYFYYRRALPKELHSIIAFKEICVALKTKELGQARLYVAKLDIEIQTLLNIIYQSLHKATSNIDIERLEAHMAEELIKIKERVGVPQRQSFNGRLLSPSKKYSPVLFSSVAKEYLKDCVTNSPKTIEHKRQTYEIFQSICGDLPIHQVTKIEARKFKEVMGGLKCTLYIF